MTGFIPFRGFTPSVDPTTPGAILDCSNLIPTLRGMKSAPSMVPFGNPAFPSQVRGAANCQLLNGTTRTFAGTATDLYEIVDRANNNVSFAPGGYTGGTNAWRFAQFGNASLATNGQDPLQQSINTGDFEPIGAVAGIALGAGGTGYTGTTVALTFTGGLAAGGVAATGHATVSGGAITNPVLDTPGSGYIGTPTVTAAGGGSGATFTVTMNRAPAAEIIETVQGFVFLFNTNDSVNGPRPNGWSCSGLFDQTQWIPSQATQCAVGVIVDTPGEITAGRAFGTNIIAYKAKSMFYGVYQGPPVIWAFNQISPQIGTPCQEAVVNIGNSQVFLGTDRQVYNFDGNLPLPIGNDVHEWLGANWSSQFQDQVRSYHDQPNSTIYWYICSSSNQDGIPDLSLVYHYVTGKFGRADARVEAALEVVSGQITWEGMGSLPNVTTWDTLPQIQYNSSFWNQASGLPGLIDATHTANSLNGKSGASSLTTSWFGDDADYTFISGILPRFSLTPDTCGGSARTLAQLGGQNPINWPMADIYDGELACDLSGRWIQTTLNFSGNHEIIGMFPNAGSAGEI